MIGMDLRFILGGGGWFLARNLECVSSGCQHEEMMHGYVDGESVD